MAVDYKKKIGFKGSSTSSPSPRSPPSTSTTSTPPPATPSCRSTASSITSSSTSRPTTPRWPGTRSSTSWSSAWPTASRLGRRQPRRPAAGLGHRPVPDRSVRLRDAGHVRPAARRRVQDGGSTSTRRSAASRSTPRICSTRTSAASTLRRRRALLLGRSLRGRQSGVGSEVLRRAPQANREARPRLLGRVEPSRGPVGLRHARRPAQRLCTQQPARQLGRDAEVGDRDHEEHRARRQKLRRGRGERLHRLLHLAVPLQLSARRRLDDRRRIQTFRGPVEPDPRRLRRVRREVRLEVHPTEIAFDIYSTHRALEAIGRREAFGFNLRPQPPHLAGDGPREVHRRVPGPHLPRAHEGRRDDPRRQDRHPLVAPEFRARAPRLGLPLRSGAATSISRPSSVR
jgi:hypothetical protein